MIANENESEVSLAYIARLQKVVLAMRHSEPDVANYRAASQGMLAEINRAQIEVRQYLARHLTEASHAARNHSKPHDLLRPRRNDAATPAST